MMKKLVSITALAVLGGVSAFGFTRGPEGPSPAQLAFEKIKAMEGTWVPAEGESKDPATIFHVSAGGTAVLETIFPGTEKEMLTVYFVENDELCLTHYCMLGNQPEMRAEIDGNKLTFGFCGGCNIDVDSTMHMNNATYEILSPNRFKTTWNLYNGGKLAEAHSFEFVRLKSADAE